MYNSICIDIYIYIYICNMYHMYHMYNMRREELDFRLFGPRPWKVLALIEYKNGFLSNPDPGENLVILNCLLILLILLIILRSRGARREELIIREFREIAMFVCVFIASSIISITSISIVISIIIVNISGRRSRGARRED